MEKAKVRLLALIMALSLILPSISALAQPLDNPSGVSESEMYTQEERKEEAANGSVSDNGESKTKEETETSAAEEESAEASETAALESGEVISTEALETEEVISTEDSGTQEEASAEDLETEEETFAETKETLEDASAGEGVSGNTVSMNETGAKSTDATTAAASPGSRIKELFDSAQGDNIWLFVGGEDVAGSFEQSAGARSYVSHFEEYIRWTAIPESGEERKNAGQRYVINAGKKGRTLQNIVDAWDELVVSSQARAVAWYLSEEDYGRGSAGLEAFGSALKTYIDGSLGLKNNSGFAVIQFPYATGSTGEDANIELYINKVKEVIEANYASDEAAYGRILLVDHFRATKELENWTKDCLTAGRLNARGHLEIGRQLCANTIAGNLPYPNTRTDSILDTKEYARPKTYANEAPSVISTHNSLRVTLTKKVIEKYGDKWNYEVTMTSPEGLVTTIRNTVTVQADAAFTIPGLNQGESWLLQLRNEAETVQLDSMEGVVEEGREGWLHQPVLFTDNATQAQMELADLLERNEPVRWLFVGDSLTQAALWTDGYDGVTQLFEKYIHNTLGRTEDVVINTAAAEATAADYLDPAREVVRLDYDADVVLVMLGTFDAKTAGQSSADEYTANLNSLLTKIKRYNPGAKIVLRTPLYTGNGEIETNLPAIVTAMETVAKEADGINSTKAEFLVNQYNPAALALKGFSWLSQADENGGERLYGEGLYPNELGQVLMFRQLIEELGLWDNDSPMTDLLYDTVSTTINDKQIDISSALSMDSQNKSITLNISTLTGLISEMGSVTLTATNKATGQSWEIKADRQVKVSGSDVEVAWAADTSLTLKGLPWNDTYEVKISGWSTAAAEELVVVQEKVLGDTTGEVKIQLNGVEERTIEGVQVISGTQVGTLGVSQDTPAGSYTYSITSAADSKGKEVADLFGIKAGRLVVLKYLDYQETYTVNVKAASGLLTGTATFTIKTVAVKKDSEVRPEDNPNGMEIPDGIWVSGIDDVTYTGKSITQTFRVYDGNKLLKEKTDYTVSYKNNKNAYTYKQKDYEKYEGWYGDSKKSVAVGTFNPKKAPQIILKMKGDYAYTKTIYYNIKPADITKEGFAVDDLTATYSGKKQTPIPVLTWNGAKLKYGKDFSIPQYDAVRKDKTAFTSPGTYDLVVTGKGNYTGEVPITLTITANVQEIAMDRVSVKGVRAWNWTGTPIVQEALTVSYKKDILVTNEDASQADFTIKYVNNQDVGTASLILTGTKKDYDGDGLIYTGTKTVTFKIKGNAISKVKVEGLEKSYTYTGEEIEPTGLIKGDVSAEKVVKFTYQANNGETPSQLTENIHYRVSYAKNVDKGTAALILTGLPGGGFTGTKKFTFKITTAPVALTGENAFTVKLTGAVLGDGSEGSPYQFPYLKGGVKPQVSLIAQNGTVLVPGRDYSVSYKNNTAVASVADEKAPTVVIKGKGNYSGTVETKFEIIQKDLTKQSDVTLVARDKVASIKANNWKQSFKLYDADGKAISAKEYDTNSVVYKLVQLPDTEKSLTAGTILTDPAVVVPAGSVVEITLQMMGENYKGEVKGSYRILKPGYDISKAAIQILPQEYTGREITITANSQFKKAELKQGNTVQKLYLVDGEQPDQKQNIEVVSYEKNTKKGTAKVTFRGLDGTDFGGTKTVTFKITGRSIVTWFSSLFNRDKGTLNKELLELKEIERAVLYYKGEKIDAVNLDKGVPKDAYNYHLKLEMKELPSIYTEVLSFEKEEDGLYANTALKEFKQDQAEEAGTARTKGIRIKVSYTENGQKVSELQKLIDQIGTNPSGTYELTGNLDVSEVTADYVFPGTFTGTIKGNGYRIYGLKVPLFETLGKGANVSGITIEKAEVTGKGILAAAINGATIEDCHIKASTLNFSSGGAGAFTGNLRDKGIISKCSAIEVFVSANNTVGGLVGQNDEGTTIVNCVVSGTVKGTNNHGSLGARIGGISGWHRGSMDKCYVKIRLQAPSAKGSGGLIGGPNTGAGSITNSVSQATGTGSIIAGFDTALEKVTNTWEHADSTITGNTLTSANRVADADKTFVTTTLGIDESMWRLIEEMEISLPGSELIQKVDGYDANKRIAYYNMVKFAPWLNSEAVVSYGNQISDSRLQTQKVSFILPMNSASQHIIGIDEDSAELVQKLLVVFEDGTSQKYRLTSGHITDELVAVYTVRNLNIPYHFNKYVVQVDENLRSELLARLQSYDYNADIASTTEEEERRQYVDYYNETVKAGKLEDFVDKLLLTWETYPASLNNSDLRAEEKEALLQELPRLIYSYTYFSKWYDIDIGDINMTDMLFFDGKLLNPALTTEYLTEQVYSGARNTHETLAFFTNSIEPKVGKNLYETLELFIKISGEEDPNDWFVNNFKGIIKEQGPIGVPEGMNVPYRIWDNLKKARGNDALLLPVLTAPQEDMILFSAPSNIFLSSINRYMETNNPANRAAMEARLEQYGQWIGRYYGTSMTLVPNAEKILTSLIHINYESPINYPSIKYKGSQHPNDTVSQEPVFKWVNEAVQRWTAKNNTTAYADGTNVYWLNLPIFGGENCFIVFTHENAHNQDGRFFYGGLGRRAGTSGEVHSEGVLAQSFQDGNMVFNLYKELSPASGATTNLSPERINTEVEIKDYYKKMFETNDVLDYLLAQAYFKLTAAEKAGVSVQAEEIQKGNSMVTEFKKISETQIGQMNLNSMESLVNNKIALRSSISLTAANGSHGTGVPWMGVYHIDEIWPSYWYQPNNPNGSTDCISFKRIAQEMTGVGGYSGGFVKWLSGESANDLEALQKITGDSTMDWNKYKINRYNAVKEKLNSVPWLDADEVIAEMVETLKADKGDWNLTQSTNLKKMYYHMIKRATNDFVNGDVYTAQVVEIASAEELIAAVKANEMGSYKLTGNIDFSGITAENGAYMGRFIGYLDGNNCTITGLSYPLFTNMVYAKVKNVTLDQAAYADGAKAVLSLNSSNVILDGVKVQNAKAVLPYIASQARGSLYYEYNMAGITTN